MPCQPFLSCRWECVLPTDSGSLLLCNICIQKSISNSASRGLNKRCPFIQPMFMDCLLCAKHPTAWNTGTQNTGKNSCSSEAYFIAAGLSSSLEHLPNPSLLLLLFKKMFGSVSSLQHTAALVSQLALIPGRLWKHPWKTTLAMTLTDSLTCS